MAKQYIIEIAVCFVNIAWITNSESWLFKMSPIKILERTIKNESKLFIKCVTIQTHIDFVLMYIMHKNIPQKVAITNCELLVCQSPNDSPVTITANHCPIASVFLNSEALKNNSSKNGAIRAVGIKYITIPRISFSDVIKESIPELWESCTKTPIIKFEIIPSSWLTPIVIATHLKHQPNERSDFLKMDL